VQVRQEVPEQKKRIVRPDGHLQQNYTEMRAAVKFVKLQGNFKK
jgi:hypothetical protein